MICPTFILNCEVLTLIGVKVAPHKYKETQNNVHKLSLLNPPSNNYVTGRV